MVSNKTPNAQISARRSATFPRACSGPCGYGATTILMAKAYPNSQFIGYDYHDRSIEAARREAAAAGVSNASFEVASAKSYPGNDYELVTFFDCLHDMGDPVGAARHVRSTLKPDGVWMIVEPM